MFKIFGDVGLGQINVVLSLTNTKIGWVTTNVILMDNFLLSYIKK